MGWTDRSMKQDCMIRRRVIARTALLALLLLTGAFGVSAEVPPAPPPPPVLAPTETLKWLGFLFGYFLTYTIRSGKTTQDVFKSFLGILGIGVSGGAALYVSPASLATYTCGAVAGFAVYAGTAVALISVFSYNSNADGKPSNNWALWAVSIGKVLLGEDFRPASGF